MVINKVRASLFFLSLTVAQTLEKVIMPTAITPITITYCKMRVWRPYIAANIGAYLACRKQKQYPSQL